MGGKVWDNEEYERLRTLYSDYSSTELEEFFPGRKAESICKKGSVLGLKKNKETKTRIHQKEERIESYMHKGYTIVRVEGHPFTNNGFIKQHRLVMERHLNRYLEHGEVVHHLNGKRSDNRIENLQLMTESEHNSFHAKGRVVSEITRQKRRENILKRYKQIETHPSFKNISVELIKKALSECNTLKQATVALGISYPTLKSRIEFYKLKEWYLNVKSHCISG